MGAWDELDTIISAEVDTTDLESLTELNDEYGIFEPLKGIVENHKSMIENGTKRAVRELANKDRYYQEKWINKNCKNPSGVLASSVGYSDEEDYSITVGTVISHIYPMSIEYGHREIVPIRAKALAFYWDGELIFRKRVRATDPRPFVAPAYDDTEQIADQILVDEIAHQGIEWD